ncbi:MAG TPA: hypothetical protein VF815_45015 [Myxococcaceae bacterium]
MSTNESKHNPSQAKQPSNKPGNPIQPKAQHSADKRKPLPFDDDNGTTGEVVETTNPKIEGFEG